MPKKLKQVDWSIPVSSGDFEPALKRFKKYLKVDCGLRDSTITGYVTYIGLFLREVGDENPDESVAFAYREGLVSCGLARSTVNDYSFAIQHFYKMLGKHIKLPILSRNTVLPYYFDGEDVVKIFLVIKNIKHLAIYQTLFYGCLRATELCNLDDRDVDLKNRTLRIRGGKGGRDGLVLISPDCATTLEKYLKVRPPLQLDDGNCPVFYTDWGQRWNKDLLIVYSKITNGRRESTSPVGSMSSRGIRLQRS